jgi:hypothetical protein
VHGQRADGVAFEGEHSRGLGALAAHITHRHAPRGRLRGVVPVPLPSHRRGRRSRHRRLPHPQVVTSSLPRRRVSRARGQDTRLESADDLVAPLYFSWSLRDCSIFDSAYCLAECIASVKRLIMTPLVRTEGGANPAQSRQSGAKGLGTKRNSRSSGQRERLQKPSVRPPSHAATTTAPKNKRKGLSSSNKESKGSLSTSVRPMTSTAMPYLSSGRRVDFGPLLASSRASMKGALLNQRPTRSAHAPKRAGQKLIRRAFGVS